jgi:C-3',4' desaturase CrtD
MFKICMENWDCIIAGSGMGALSAASLLAQQGKKVLVIEQNYLPGGCTSSYWRKGFVFEAGATTLVGLDTNQPLRYLIDRLKINIEAIPLELPMQVQLSDGTNINRYQSLEKWIAEAEICFGIKNQKEFWQKCYAISQFVWSVSLKQTHFPISNWKDLYYCIKNIDFQQVKNLKYAFKTVEDLLKEFDLLSNQKFIDFINAQLLITAQNHINQVNVLFGATALCYTNYGNYYINGGLINLVNPFVEYIKNNGGEVRLREAIESVSYRNNKYEIKTSKSVYYSEYFVSGLPINNTIKIYPKIAEKYKNKLMGSEQLNSAFQMGIGFRRNKKYPTIHFQIHLKKPLSYIGSSSIFVSLSHEQDLSRSDDEQNMVASVSTHWKDPQKNINFDKQIIENEVIEALENANILQKIDIIYSHSSTPQNWEKWTKRAFGFVGGYPQYKKIKPWQLLDARLDGNKAYIVGDSVYPGQGIPGVVLGGIIAVEKINSDK